MGSQVEGRLQDKIEKSAKEKELEILKLRTKMAQRRNGKESLVNGSPTQSLASGSNDHSHKNETQSANEVTERSEEIIRALEAAAGKRLLIAIKGFPDPDNLGTGLALKWMAKQFGISSTILHFEEISHHENRALVKKLDLDIEHFTSDFDFSKFDYFAVNDAQNPELPVPLPASCELLVFVDHHKSLGTVQSRFYDVREDAGSTSGIYCEYLKHPRFRFAGESAEEVKIATALMHGIRSDTDNFMNATRLDFAGSEYIARFMDKELLSLISQQSIPARTMDLTQVALQRKDIRGNFMFSGVGYVRDEDRDGIGQCADYLLHREGIDTVIVFGIVNGQYIDGSLRTKSHTLDPDKWLKDVFGKDQRGTYYGGGRKDKGGFQIPIGVFAHCSDKELLWILVKKTIEELFYQKIGVDDRDMTNLDVE